MEESKTFTPLEAIKMKCLDCMGGMKSEVKLCPITDCPLYPYRLGKNPFRTKREYTEEEKAAMVERLRSAKSEK